MWKIIIIIIIFICHHAINQKITKYDEAVTAKNTASECQKSQQLVKLATLMIVL